MKNISLSIMIVVCFIGGAAAQTPLYTDGVLMPKGSLGVGFFYGYDTWTKYWEGTLLRENGNVGTVSTQSLTWMGAYGLTKRACLIATLPYVWTHATTGTLHGLKGVQDLTVALKYDLLGGTFGAHRIDVFGMLAVSAPMSNYSKDFLPLSIGLGSTNIGYRLTLNYKYHDAWFATASGAYTWRSNIYLDRISYYSDGHIYFTDEVWMPNTFDWIVRTGYAKNALRAEVYYVQQNTLGGGDIRRQDMPFASNKMNFGKVGASLVVAPAKLKNIAFRGWGNYTLDGRNVGKSITFTVGAMYALQLRKEPVEAATDGGK